MKLNRTKIFISVSSIALLLVLIIQVNWILQTAKMKEALFNEKANMVLAKTSEALGTNKEMCKQIGDNLDKDSIAGLPSKLGSQEVHVIDSLFKYYMKFYNVHIDYSFVVAKPKPAATKNINDFASYIYNKPIEVTSASGFELKLILPDKKQFIMAEMGPMFISSILLILIVLLMFWRTTRSLILEKQIAEHTTDFLNNMTHEFKTPLTNIGLAGKMIAKESAIEQAAKINHYSGIILAENEKLKNQVEQVLSMTALERGEIPVQKTELIFDAVIKDALRCMSVQLENKNGQIELTLNAAETVLMGDKIHLTNAFCNLIDNAIKYSRDNPKLFIETRNSGRDLIVLFADNGIGIEKQYQKKVFEKYFRVPNGDVHDVKGFGLGLAYVKKIISLHGGAIKLDSEKRKGTTFTITLPHA